MRPLNLYCYITILVGITVTSLAQADIQSPGLEGNFDISLDGGFDLVDPNTWILENGTSLSATSLADGSAHRIQASATGVRVRCASDGIVYASGDFILEMTRTNGIRYCLPSRHKGMGGLFGKSEIEDLVFVKDTELPEDTKNGVAFDGKNFSVKGLASVEALHPAKGPVPATLISVRGTNTETELTTDLKTMVEMGGKGFQFWHAARAELASEIGAIEEAEIDEERPGAGAYAKSREDALEGFGKLEEAYEVLQRNLYSQQVTERMLDEGVPIPRMTLAEATLIRGNLAFSIRPFVNWQGAAKVVIDRAQLKGPDIGINSSPVLKFRADSPSIRSNEKTRLIVDGENSRVENKTTETSEWSTRRTYQFDFDVERTLTFENESVLVLDVVDPAGFFRRKGIAAPGLIRLSEMVVTKNSLDFRLQPQSENSKAVDQILDFLNFKRILLHPDRSRRMKLVPSALRDGGVGHFLSDVFDQLAEAIHTEDLGEIGELNIRVEQDGSHWIAAVEVVDRQKKRAIAQHEADLPDSADIDGVWNHLKRAHEGSSWLELDWGLAPF